LTAIWPVADCDVTKQTAEAGTRKQKKQKSTGDTNSDLRSASDHVFDEITMTRSVDDGDVVLRCLKLPQRNVNRDATFTLGFQLVQHPRVLERTFAHLPNKAHQCKTCGQEILSDKRTSTCSIKWCITAAKSVLLGQGADKFGKMKFPEFCRIASLFQTITLYPDKNGPLEHPS